MTTFSTGYELRLLLAFLLLGGGSACSSEGGDADPDEGRSSSEEACTTDAMCDDGILCNGVELCDPGSSRATSDGCVPGQTIICDDGVECTEDSCDEETGACINDAPDEDGDGHRDAHCLDSSGVPIGDDCDDTDSGRFPGNEEVCEPGKVNAIQDEDCDPSTLGDADQDGDDYQNVECCNPDGDELLCGQDCDDENRQTYPGAAELCDKEDNDCNGEVDDSVDIVNWYPDLDLDLYGDPNGNPVATCENLADQGYADNSNDCDDSEVQRNPGAEETCDELDNDCNDVVDDGLYCGDCDCELSNATVSCEQGPKLCEIADCSGVWLHCDQEEPNGVLNGCESNGTTEDTCGSCDTSCGTNEICVGFGTLSNYQCQCAPGSYNDGGSCKDCPPGQYCPGDDQPAVNCPSQHWDDDSNSATACVPWKDCAPGHRLLTEGTETSDRVCEPCDESYTTIENANHCIPWTVCTGSLSYKKRGTSTSDAECVAATRFLVSQSSAGVEGADHSGNPFLSADGNQVVFYSIASNLVAGDENGVGDIFLHDRTSGETKRVSVASDGSEANGVSQLPRVSGDGKIIAFQTSATNLGSGAGAYVHELESGTTSLVSVDSDEKVLAGAQLRCLSKTGRFVGFVARDPNFSSSDQLYLRDRDTGTTTLVSKNASDEPAWGRVKNFCFVSEDGNFVTFEVIHDAGNNLVPDGEGSPSAYLKNLSTGAVSVLGENEGVYPPLDLQVLQMTSDARYFLLKGRVDGFTPTMSSEIMLYDRTDNDFVSLSNLIYSEVTFGALWMAWVTDDGNKVVFSAGGTITGAANTNQTDIFLANIAEDSIQRIGTSSAGDIADTLNANVPVVTPDGSVFAWSSSATNLIDAETNGKAHIFVGTLP